MSSLESRPSVLANEFGAVRVQVDNSGRGPRLLMTNVETGASIFLDVLELASLTEWPDERRPELLVVGPYELDAEPPGLDAELP